GIAGLQRLQLRDVRRRPRVAEVDLAIVVHLREGVVDVRELVRADPEDVRAPAYIGDDAIAAIRERCGIARLGRLILRRAGGENQRGDRKGAAWYRAAPKGRSHDWCS